MQFRGITLLLVVFTFTQLHLFQRFNYQLAFADVDSYERNQQVKCYTVRFKSATSFSFSVVIGQTRGIAFCTAHIEFIVENLNC